MYVMSAMKVAGSVVRASYHGPGGTPEDLHQPVTSDNQYLEL